MEGARGENLGVLLLTHKKPFEFEDVLQWTEQLLVVLEWQHTQEPPVIHGVLKPQALLLTEDNKIKLLSHEKPSAETLNYSPIEQLLPLLHPQFLEFISQRHKKEIDAVLEQPTDAQSDLFSLGGTLYQLLTAYTPHDTLKRALDIWAGKPDPLAEPVKFNSKIPAFFNSVILKAMEVDRNKRFASAKEMSQAITSGTVPK
jgi:serine/threonine protein kinase